jgi:hypothetical protein
MFQPGTRRWLRLGAPAVVSVGVLFWYGVSSHGQGQSPPAVPATADMPPAQPALPDAAAPPAAAPAETPAETPADPGPDLRTLTFQQCALELQKARDEVKRLTVAREQKRAELDDLDARYRDAQAYLTSLLQRKVEVCLHEVDVSRQELRAQHGAEPALPVANASGYAPNAAVNDTAGDPMPPVAPPANVQWKRAPVPGRN